MIHKYMNYAWIIVAASIIMTGSTFAKIDEEDLVGEMDCQIYDVIINGFTIDRIDAEGFLTEIRD